MRETLRIVIGGGGARRDRREGLHRVRARGGTQGIAALAALAGAADDGYAEAPIFVLSAGWRSGSTLLQRLVTSGHGVLIWGEAYDRAGLVQALAETTAPFDAVWPPPAYLRRLERVDDLSARWTANLYPPPEALRAGYRAMLTELFAAPARQAGATRWGFKEVRLGLLEATFLRWLFPAAKFLFVRRALEPAYASYRAFSPGMGWYARWPREPAFTPFAFGRHHARLCAEHEAATRLVGGVSVAYEALASGDVDVEALATYLGVDMDAGVLARRIGGRSPEEADARPSGLERLALAAGAAVGRRDAARMLGGRAPPATYSVLARI